MPQMSTLQLALLKTFSRDVSDEDVREIKRLITRYFAQKATKGADQVWEEQEWDDKKVDELLNSLRLLGAGKTLSRKFVVR